jgi:hypothetical protein
MPDGDGQQVAFIKLQKWLGVSLPINSAEDYVLAPLSSITGQPTLQAAIVTYRSAGAEGEGGLDDRLHQRQGRPAGLDLGAGRGFRSRVDDDEGAPDLRPGNSDLQADLA